MYNETQDTTKSGANAASARLAPSKYRHIMWCDEHGVALDEHGHCPMDWLNGVASDSVKEILKTVATSEDRIINGVRCRHVAAYTTQSGKHIPAHWRPVRRCRSWKTAKAPKPIASATAQVLAAQAAAIAAMPAPANAAIVAAASGEGEPVVLDEVASAPVIVTPAPKPMIQQANVDASLVPNVPDYYPQNGEVDLMEKAIGAQLNVILTGPTGCGKTHLTERVCQNNNREMFTIQGGAGATYERIIAQKDLVSDGKGGTLTQLTKGILPIAMQRGAVLYLDEPNAIPSEVLFYLFGAMDYRRTITLENGEVIKAAQGFVVVGAMNEGAGYAGTALLNAAFRQRAVVIDMQYLPAKREEHVLTSRTGVDKDIAKRLVKVATALRGGAIKTPIGTRALLACATLHTVGVSIHAAIECAITNQIAAQFANERKAVSDVVAAQFGLEAK